MFLLHRGLGVLSALVVLWLAVSGFLLNHLRDWSLDQRSVASARLLDWYGIEVSPPERGYRVPGGHWISALAGAAYFDARPLGPVGSLKGVAAAHGLNVVLGSESALLLDAQGQLLERFTADALPGRPRAIAAMADGFVLDTDAGRFASGPELLDWSPLQTPAPPTLPETALPADLRRAIAQSARAQELRWSRVLADLHSGRAFGRYGPAVIDFFAGAFALIALSGVWLWLRHMRQQRRRGHPGDGD